MTAVTALTGLSLLVTALPASATDAEISVGNGPSAVALSPDGTRLYVTNQNSNSISAIDTSNNMVVATTTVGSSPAGIAVNPNGSAVFVTNLFGNSVSVVSTSTNAVIATIAVGTFPYGVTFNSEGTVAYVVKQDDNAVSVIDTVTNTVVGVDIAVGSKPFGIALSPDGTKLYVTNQWSDTVSVISVATQLVTSTIGVGDNPFYVAFSPDGLRVYVTNIGDSTLSVIDVATDSLSLTSPSIIFPATPVGVAFAPSGFFAYVAMQNGDIAEINTATHSIDNTRPIITAAGTQVSGVTISGDGASLYVANSGLASISVRDLPLPSAITSGSLPAAAVGAEYSFTVVATGRPAPTFTISSGVLPSGLSLDPASGEISGTPSSDATTSTFAVAANNGVGPADTATYTIVFSPVLAATGIDVAPWLAAAIFFIALGSAVAGSRATLARAMLEA